MQCLKQLVKENNLAAKKNQHTLSTAMYIVLTEQYTKAIQRLFENSVLCKVLDG